MHFKVKTICWLNFYDSLWQKQRLKDIKNCFNDSLKYNKFKLRLSLSFIVAVKGSNVRSVYKMLEFSKNAKVIYNDFK